MFFANSHDISPEIHADLLDVMYLLRMIKLRKSPTVIVL